MIFCVEDDSQIRNLMLYTLTASGFEAEGFENGTAFFEALRKETPQLILLDIMMPGKDGIQILKELRSNPETSEIPIIIASAKGTEYDKIIGLDLGADDYLAKPFGMMEMVSRVKAVLRRTMPKPSAPVFQIGDLILDRSEHIVTQHNCRVPLTLKEFSILELFMQNPGIVFTRDQLLSRIWGSDFVGESRTVDVHIGTLRTKLGPCGNYIQTVRGVGYRLEVPL